MPDCPDKDDCRYAGTECWHCRSETGDPADDDWYENKPSFDENDANPLKTALQLAPQSTRPVEAGQCHPLEQTANVVISGDSDTVSTRGAAR